MRSPLAKMNVRMLLDRFGTYLVARLLTDPEAAPALAIARSAQDSLRERLAIHQESKIVVADALSARNHAARELDQAIRALAFALKTIDNRRDSSHYEGYFPHGYGRLVKSPIAGRADSAEVLIEILDQETVETVVACREPLVRARATLLEAKKAYSAAVIVEKSNREILRAEKRRWVAAYRACHGMLLVLFREDRERIESFFRGYSV